MKDSKNHAVWARCHLTGEASGQDCTIMSSGVSVAARSRERRRVTLKRLRKESARSARRVVLAVSVTVAMAVCLPGSLSTQNNRKRVHSRLDAYFRIWLTKL